MSEDRRPSGWLRAVVVVAGVHSLLLGLTLLFFPGAFTDYFGFPREDSVFFPTQTGAFLVALGIVYLLALRDRALVWAIVASKSVAVVFLFTHALLLDAPPSVLAAGVGDLVLLGATLGALAWARKESDKTPARSPPSRD